MEFVGIAARTIVSGIGSLMPTRMILMWTVVPFGPLRRLTTSSSDSSSVATPSTSEMTSPARMPRRAAGVPSSGVMTVTWSLRLVTRMPRP